MATSAADLETRLKLPETLTNEFQAQEGDVTVTYRGTAFSLLFDGLDSISGGALLEKMTPTKQKSLFGIIKILPYKRTVWRAYAFSNLPIGGGGLLFGDFSSGSVSPTIYFINRGKPVQYPSTEWFEKYHGYKSQLATNAAGKGIILSAELLNQVFSPIDTQLMDFYQKAKAASGKEAGKALE